MSKLDELQDVATDELLDFFKMGNEDADFQRARIAQASLATVARLKATDRVRDATQFHILRVLSEDNKELRDYLAVSLPDYVPAKVLPA